MPSYVAPFCGWMIFGAFPSAISLTASTWNQHNAGQVTEVFLMLADGLQGNEDIHNIILVL